MDSTLDSRHVTFPGGGGGGGIVEDVDSTQQKEKALRKKHSKKKTHEVTEIVLDDIASDVSDAPRKSKLEEVCHVQNDDTALGSLAHTTEDYLKQRNHENQEFEANALSSLESLAPFKLKWVYGRLHDVKPINLVGLHKNHIAYASSNIVIIYDFVGNEQQCLQGHKNTITALALDKHNRFFASSDSGYRSLIIIWDSLTGKALKYFPEPHDGKGCVTLAFTGVDFILASIGNEAPGKQTICLWDFNPNNQKKHPVVLGQFPHNSSDLLRELSFDDNRPEFFAATGDKSIVFCTWVRVAEQNGEEQSGDSIFCYKPRTRKNFMSKYKKFCNSLWMKEGKWLVTSTMSGYLCVWTPPVTLALEDPPDPKKNVRELKRYYRLSEDGLTSFTVYKEYAVVGDEKGIIRFFDHDLKLLRWTKNFFLPSVCGISFNLTDDLPAFKKLLRATFDKESKDYLKRGKSSRVRDYSLGGAKDRELSMTTIHKPPMSCSDFVFSISTGDIYYYHFNQSQIDLLINGTPGKFVTCDVCPSSNNVVFCTRKGEVQVYDFVTHKRVFADQIFVGNHRVSTMKFHPTGFFLCFGLIDGHLCFRRNFTWKTFIQPVFVTANPILRIIFSEDGLLLSYFTSNKIVVLMRYLPKAKSYVILGKCRTHQLDICDVQFFHDPSTGKNRLFSLGLDRYLIEYDIANCNPGDPKGLRILKILRLEETCQPTAMVFDGPGEFGVDCITFSNTLNKLRMFQYNQERVRGTVSGPVFGREHAINRMIEFPAQMSSTRFKKFIIFVRGNKLGIIDTPLDGNPHKYMAVLTHPGPIIDISVVAEKQQIFTIGNQDNAALQWEASVRSVEATVIMGGSGITPFYHNLRRNWGGACQDVVKDIDLIFFFLNLKRVDTQTDIFNITRTIRISEIPAVCRACGFYPSEYEVDLMIDEARRIKMLDQHYTDDFSTEFSFEDFIKLFSNHYYRITDSEIEDAFRFLGFEEKEDPYICRSDFVYFLTTEGEQLKPFDFPIYFESMYLDQSQTVFSDVHCHIRAALPSITSESPYTGGDASLNVDATQVDESLSSSSSSTLTADLDDDDESVERIGSKSSEGDKDGEEDDDDDDDDEEGGEEEEGVEKKPKKKKEKQVVVRAEAQIEDNDDMDEPDTDFFGDEDPSKRKGSVEEKKRFSISSGEPGGGTALDEEPEDTTEDLMDLPERIDLSFFLSKMLPEECQQTIHWRPEFRQKRTKDLTPRPEVEKRKRNQEYYDTLMKQLIDPNFPIHKKLLNALYAEYYMEHGNFSVPEELQYPGYGPSIDESWFQEEGEPDITKHDDDLDESPVLSAQDSLLDAKEEEEGEEDEKKKGKSKHKAAKDEEEEVGEEDEKKKGKSKHKAAKDEEEGEGEGEDEGQEYLEEGEEEETAPQHLSIQYGGEGDETLPIAAAIFQSFQSDEYEYEMLGEDDTSTHYNYETEEGEDASAFSAPFSISDQVGSREATTGGGSEDGRTGIVPGYNSDNTEYDDVENVYDEEDAAFIREVNETFRPAQPDEANEGSGETGA